MLMNKIILLNTGCSEYIHFKFISLVRYELTEMKGGDSSVDITI